MLASIMDRRTLIVRGGLTALAMGLRAADGLCQGCHRSTLRLHHPAWRGGWSRHGRAGRRSGLRRTAQCAGGGFRRGPEAGCDVRATPRHDECAGSLQAGPGAVRARDRLAIPRPVAFRWSERARDRGRQRLCATGRLDEPPARPAAGRGSAGDRGGGDGADGIAWQPRGRLLRAVGAARSIGRPAPAGVDALSGRCAAACAVERGAVDAAADQRPCPEQWPERRGDGCACGQAARPCQRRAGRDDRDRRLGYPHCPARPSRRAAEGAGCDGRRAADGPGAAVGEHDGAGRDRVRADGGGQRHRRHRSRHRHRRDAVRRRGQGGQGGRRLARPVGRGVVREPRPETHGAARCLHRRRGGRPFRRPTRRAR